MTDRLRECLVAWFLCCAAVPACAQGHPANLMYYQCTLAGRDGFVRTCLVYFSGFLDALTVAREKLNICPKNLPEGVVKPSMLADAFVKYGRQHQDRLGEPITKVVEAALMSEWPCDGL